MYQCTTQHTQINKFSIKKEIENDISAEVLANREINNCRNNMLKNV